MLYEVITFPEVAGEAGIFYELNNAKDLEEKIKYTIENKEFREEHIRLGLEQVKKFSWDEAALQCLETVITSYSIHYTKLYEQTKM